MDRKSEEAQVLFDAGMEAIQNDEPEQAADLFREAIRLNVGPQQQVYARKFLAHVAFTGDAHDEGITYLESALKLDQEHGFGEFEGSEADLRDLLFTMLDASYLERADSLVAERGRVYARDYLVERLGLAGYLGGPFLPLVQHKIAELSTELGDNVKALEHYRATLDAHVPARFHSSRAPVLYQEICADARRKIQAHEQTSRSKSALDNAETIYVDASRALHAGKHQLAVQLYREALEAGLNQRDQVFAWSAICSALLTLGDTQNGMEAGEMALKLDATGEASNFDEKAVRWMLLQPLDLHWSGKYADEILACIGEDAAIKSLKSKVELTRHLPGIHLPLTHIRVADLAFNANDLARAREYYGLGCQAELPLWDSQKRRPIGQRYQEARLRAESRSKVMKEGCWIATVAFGENSWEVARLQLFRERVLRKHWWGRAIIRSYYRTGPYVAGMMRRHPHFTGAVRGGFLRPILWILGQPRIRRVMS